MCLVSYNNINSDKTERKCNDNNIAGRGVCFFNDELSINSKKIIAHFRVVLGCKPFVVSFFFLL